jgi:hypothetical protein
MTGDSGMRRGESRRLSGSTGPDAGAPRPREVAVGAGLGGFAAIVLLVVSALLSGGGGRHPAAVVRPGTSGDGPAGVTVASPGSGDASGQDAKNVIATAAAADPSPLGPLETNLQLTAAGAPSAPDPAKTTAAQARTGMHSSEPPAPKVRPLAAPPAVAVPPPAGPAPVPVAGTVELAAGNDPSSPASPQPEPPLLCREDSDFAGSLLRSLGLESCTP